MLDQAGSEFENTVFENNRRDSIRTVSLRRIMENVIMKNFNYRDEVVRGLRSKSNMPSIIQSRVDSKGLSEKLSFRERRDSCAAIWLKLRRKS